jgi:hypothetical protein
MAEEGRRAQWPSRPSNPNETPLKVARPRLVKIRILKIGTVMNFVAMNYANRIREKQ